MHQKNQTNIMAVKLRSLCMLELKNIKITAKKRKLKNLQFQTISQNYHIWLLVDVIHRFRNGK